MQFVQQKRITTIPKRFLRVGGLGSIISSFDACKGLLQVSGWKVLAQNESGGAWRPGGLDPIQGRNQTNHIFVEIGFTSAHIKHRFIEWPAVTSGGQKPTSLRLSR